MCTAGFIHILKLSVPINNQQQCVSLSVSKLTDYALFHFLAMRNIFIAVFRSHVLLVDGVVVCFLREMGLLWNLSSRITGELEEKIKLCFSKVTLMTQDLSIRTLIDKDE